MPPPPLKKAFHTSRQKHKFTRVFIHVILSFVIVKYILILNVYRFLILIESIWTTSISVKPYEYRFHLILVHSLSQFGGL